MKSLLEALNRPADAFHYKNKWLAWLLVAFTIIINTVFDSLLSYFEGVGHPEINVFHIIQTSVFGCISYIAVCVVIWQVCKCFGSETKFTAYYQTWGLTYFPTILCSFTVVFSDIYFTLFWNNKIWGMLLGIILIGILIWKTILYVIYLYEVAELKGGRLIGSFFIIGLFILLLAVLNGYVGLKTPIL